MPKYVAALLALAALALLPPIATGAGKSDTERRFGGSDATVSTAAEVRAVVEAGIAAGSLDPLLADLPPGQAKKVVDDGFTPAYAINTSNGEITPVDPSASAAKAAKPPAAIRKIGRKYARRAVERAKRDASKLARASTTRNYRSMYCQAHSSVGVHIFTYRQDWWWDWGGVERPRVVNAGHAENSTYTAPGYTYVGSQYLAPVGQMGTWYVGRQTQGTFRFTIQGTNSNKYQRMTGIVYGDGTSGWQCS